MRTRISGTSTGRLVQFVDNHTTGTPPTFCDAGSITLNTTGGMTAGGTPYPQYIYVTNLTGTVSDITLQLPNIAHNFPRDIDFLLVSPTGVAFVPLASAGGSNTVSGVTLTLSDSAASLVAVNSLVTGSFLPTDYQANVMFPAPAPAGPYNVPPTQGAATFASTFSGLDPNGVWSLYVFNNARGDSGTIGGYCLTFTTSAAADDHAKPEFEPSFHG